jgi:hypothetical protein
MLDALRAGRVHMTGLRLLAPHLNADNVTAVLGEAAGKSMRQIEELIARLAPKPPVPTVIRRVPAQVAPQATPSTLFEPAHPLPSPERAPVGASVPPPSPDRQSETNRPVLKPLAQDTYKFQFTASRACHDMLREAQALLRHRIPNGDVGTIIERALKVLVAQVKKERFATGRKARTEPTEEPMGAGSRHIPDWVKRVVFERDGGRCTFTDAQGRRCTDTSTVEFDHVHGFARIPVHRPEDIRLLCRAHNQHAAEKMYGRDFMARARADTTKARLGLATPTLPGMLSG